MEAIVTSCASRAANVAGSLISLALVFGGSAAVAEGLTGFAAPGESASSLIGGFSDVDLEQLEHASVAEATAARLAALGQATPVVATAPTRGAAPLDSASASDGELFPYSGRILPLLVAQPQAEASIVRASVTLRPGLVQPVGVSRASLRSPTPTERTGR